MGPNETLRERTLQRASVKKFPEYGDWSLGACACEAQVAKVRAVTSERRTTVVWISVALVVFGAALGWKKLRSEPRAALADWQRSVDELSADQRRTYEAIREGITAVEKVRANTKQWPQQNLSTDASWSRSQQRLAINYVGETKDLRWLVLFLEPDPRTNEAPPPDDDEHHTLSDGTPLHVTIWSQPLTTPRSELVTAFPAAEGWVERVRR